MFRSNRGNPTLVLLAALVVWAGSAAMLRAETPEKDASAKTDASKTSPEQQLAEQQRAIAEKYKHLEVVLLRMAELDASKDPRRAALLRRVIAESKDRMVEVQFDRMAELLAEGRLSNALENQKDLERDLNDLIELLLSENRARQLAAEKAKVIKLIQRTNELLREQKSVQGRTAGGDDAKRLTEEQGNLAKKTGDLAKDVEQRDKDAAASPDGDNNKDKKDSSEKNGEQSGDQNGKSDSEGKKGAKSQGGQNGQGGQDSQGQSSPGGQSEPSPSQKNLQQAQQRMSDAQKKLEKAKREGAVEDQEEAIRQLEKAKAELEEILRQLREEEIERMLLFLEARFKAMLKMEQFIYKNTQRLDKVPAKSRTREHEIEAGRLGQKQSLVVLDADKALLILREDGTSAAFPEAVTQMRDDMNQVAARLGRAKVDQITQAIEQDVIAALQEMIESLQRAILEQEARRVKSQQQPGEPPDPPLIDELSELRMIRALQLRVNQRTNRYSKLVEGEQADNADLIDALRRLAEYQSRIHRITRDLESGKNK